MPPRKRYFDESSRAPMTPSASHEKEGEKKSLWERVGGLPGAGAAASRGISGILAAGGPWGAAVGGGGEALAQWLESFNPDIPKPSAAQRAARIGVESTLGAVPFAQWVRKGEALGNFLRGGAFSAVGDVARQMAEQETLDPTKVDLGRTATAGTIGGSAATGVQKFMDFLGNRGAKAATDAAGKAAGDTKVKAPTRTLPSGRQVSTGKTAPTPTPKSATPSSKLAEDFLAQLEGERPGVFKRTPAEPAKAPRTEFQVPKAIETRHTIGAPPAKHEDFVTDFQKELSKTLDKRVGAASKEAQAKTQFESDQYIKQLDEERSLDEAFQKAMDKRNATYLDEKAAAEAIAREREGLVEQAKSVTESHTQNIPGGRVSVTKKFGPPPEDADVAEDVLDELLPSGSPARNVYDSWRAGGLSHEKALQKAAEGATPRGGIKLGKNPPPEAPPPAAPPVSGPKPPTPPAPAPVTSTVVPPGTPSPGRMGPPIEDIREGFEGSIATLMRRLATLDPESAEAKRIISTVKKRQQQAGVAEEINATVPPIGPPDVEPPAAAAPVSRPPQGPTPPAPAAAEIAADPSKGFGSLPPEAQERFFLLKWLADDLENMPFQKGGTTPKQRRDAFENWRPGDPEEAKYAIGEGFSSGRSAGTPTQEMFNAAGISGSRGDIANRLRKMIETGTVDPRVDTILEGMRRAWNPEAGKFDFSNLDDEARKILGDIDPRSLRGPMSGPNVGPDDPTFGEYFTKYFGPGRQDEASDAVDTGEDTLLELMDFFGAQAPKAGRRGNIQEALRTGEDRALKNWEINRFLSPHTNRALAPPDPVPFAPQVAPELPPQVPAAAAAAAAPEAGPASALANFFKSRVDAMGNAYRQAKEIPPPKGGTEAYKAAKRLLGKGLQDEAKAAGLPTGKAAKQPSEPVPPGPGEPGWPPTSQILEQSAPRVAEPEDSELTKLLRFFRSPAEAEAANTGWVQKELESLQDPAARQDIENARIDEVLAPHRAANEAEAAAAAEELRQLQEEAARLQQLENLPPVLGPGQTRTKGRPAKPEPPAPAIKAEPGPPRLVKPNDMVIKKKSETGMFRPEVALPMLSTALGGLTGLAYGQNEGYDPLASALLGALGGGAIGFGGANIGRLASKGSEAIGDITQGVKESLGNREDIAEGVTQAIEKFPNLQRANLLTGFNLPVNAAVGPWGSVLFGGLENAIANKIGGGSDMRGANVVREALNPAKFLREMYENRDEAARLVAQGELGRSEGVNLNPGGNLLEQYMALPAVAMTAGDVTARNLLTRMGFPEDVARQITLTSEPEGAIGKAIANFGRGSVNETSPRGNRVGKALLNSMLPFRRTPANIVDQGWERLPGFGLAAHAIEPGDMDWNTALAQQAISIPLAAASYGLGENLDPETARWVRRVVSNAAGQYSMPASLAFAAGSAANRGLSDDQSILRIANEAFPLPTTEGVTDLGRFLSNTWKGEPAEIPRTMQPTILRDIFSSPVEQPPTRVGGLPDLGEYRRRRRGQ